MRNAQLWLSLIPVLVPVAIAGLKTLAPRIPRPLLPIIAPLLGGVSDAAIAWAAGGTANPVLGMALGSAGVGLREIVDQLGGNANFEVRNSKVGCLLLAASCLLVSGCATLQDDVDTVHARLQGIVQADLDAALASASRPLKDGSPIDPDGVRCFGTLKELSAGGALQLPQVKGALSAVEAARITRLYFESSSADLIGTINSACAAWWMSAKGQSIKLAVEVMGFMK